MGKWRMRRRARGTATPRELEGRAGCSSGDGNAHDDDGCSYWNGRYGRPRQSKWMVAPSPYEGRGREETQQNSDVGRGREGSGSCRGGIREVRRNRRNVRYGLSRYGIAL